ncbi:hypothetical protein ACOMHN_054733 [Nucella lapillus]
MLRWPQMSWLLTSTLRTWPWLLTSTMLQTSTMQTSWLLTSTVQTSWLLTSTMLLTSTVQTSWLLTSTVLLTSTQLARQGAECHQAPSMAGAECHQAPSMPCIAVRAPQCSQVVQGYTMPAAELDVLAILWSGSAELHDTIERIKALTPLLHPVTRTDLLSGQGREWEGKMGDVSQGTKSM